MQFSSSNFTAYTVSGIERIILISKNKNKKSCSSLLLLFFWDKSQMHGKTMYGQIQREELGFYHSSFFCRTRCCLAGFEGRDASDSSSSIPLHRSRSALRPTFLFAISRKHVKLGFPRSQRKRREGFFSRRERGGRGEMLKESCRRTHK